MTASALLPGDAASPTTGTLTLTGFVRETAPTDNVPVADARVDILDPATGSFTGRFVMTDARGAYRFPGLAGSITFRASKEGYEGDSDQIHLAETLTLDSAQPRFTGIGSGSLCASGAA